MNCECATGADVMRIGLFYFALLAFLVGFCTWTLIDVRGRR